MTFSQSTHLLMCMSLETLTPIMRTGQPMLVELINLANSVIISNNLILRWLTFLLRSQNPFAMISSLSELYFRFRRFILLVQMKKVISMNYGSSASCWKPWRKVRFDLILMMWDICINSNLNPLTKFTRRTSPDMQGLVSHKLTACLSIFNLF